MDKKKFPLWCLALNFISLALLVFSYSFYEVYQVQKMNNFNYDNNLKTNYYQQIDGLKYYINDVYQNRYNTWRQSKSREVDTEYLANILKNVEQADLDQLMACKTLNEKSSVENAISCIDAYYENKDAYSYIRAQLDQIKAGVDVIDSISYRNQVRNTYIIFDDILNIKIKADADLNKVNNTYKATYSQLEDEILKIRKL